MDRQSLARVSVRLPIIAVIAAIVWYVHDTVLAPQPQPRLVTQQVRLLDTKPPPLEEPAEVPEETFEAPLPESAPGDRLALDADGEGAGDGFGLAAKPGGMDITTFGDEFAHGTGEGEREWQRYGGLIERHLSDLLRADSRLRAHAFTITVTVRVSGPGQLTRVRLVGSSGDPEVDRALRDLLQTAPALSQPPPPGMPQPVRLRISSVHAGSAPA
jgi:periplasmic protein TonB